MHVFVFCILTKLRVHAWTISTVLVRALRIISKCEPGLPAKVTHFDRVYLRSFSCSLPRAHDPKWGLKLRLTGQLSLLLTCEPKPGILELLHSGQQLFPDMESAIQPLLTSKYPIGGKIATWLHFYLAGIASTLQNFLTNVTRSKQQSREQSSNELSLLPKCVGFCKLANQESFKADQTALVCGKKVHTSWELMCQRCAC